MHCYLDTVQLTQLSELGRCIPLHILLDVNIQFTIFPNHGRDCLFQYHFPVTARQTWGNVGLDSETYAPGSTPFTSDDSVDTRGFCTVAGPASISTRNHRDQAAGCTAVTEERTSLAAHVRNIYAVRVSGHRRSCIVRGERGGWLCPVGGVHRWGLQYFNVRLKS